MKIWFDITNTPHVHFFAPLIKYLQKEHIIFVTARDFSETLPLLESYDIKYEIIGDHKGKNRIKKILGLIFRVKQLLREVPQFDIALGIGGQNITPVSALRRKPSIVFTDNDTSYKWHSYKLGSHFVFPSYFDYETVIKKFGVKRDQIHLYDGFKEEVYMAQFTPDPTFLNRLPFSDFITIRPENLKANYVPKDSKTIVPELLEVFKDENVLFLPRFKEEREYAKGFENVFIPDGILSGKDVCFYSKAILTGAGTFAREAALLGTPAVSFFPGKNLLTVDKIMQEKGWEYSSRSPKDIYIYIKNAKKRNSQIDHCNKVLSNLLQIIDSILDKYK